jgi:hypothetical protein
MESKGVKNFTRARKIKNVHERARELYTCTSKLAFFTICSVIDCIYGWEESRRKKNRISESLRGVMNSILFDYSNSIDFYWIDQFLMLRIEWISRTWGEEKKVHYKFILMNFSISLNCNGAVEGMRERVAIKMTKYCGTWYEKLTKEVRIAIKNVHLIFFY